MSTTILTRIRDLKFKQLIVFERAVTLGSTHKAAEALHMSQPNVFKIIGQLEELLDVPLFERSSKGMAPTFFAERLLERVRPMLGDARALAEELAAMRSGDQGQVGVGTLISASAYLLPSSITLFKQRHPLVNIAVREATNTVLFPMLSVGELDVIVGRLPDMRNDGFTYHALYEEQLIVVTRTDHPLARNKVFSLTELIDYPWIVPLNDSPVRSRVDDFFKRHQLPAPVNRVESLSMLTNLGVLRCSDAITMLPKAAARPLVKAGSLYELPIEEAILFGTVGYSLCADRKPTPAGNSFIGTLKEVSARIVADDWHLTGNSLLESPAVNI